MPHTVLALGLTGPELAALDAHDGLDVRPVGPDGDGPHRPAGPADGDPGTDGVDVVVVRAATARDLAVLQRAHAQHRDASAVLVLPAGDPGAVRRALVYTPGVPADVEVLEGPADGDLPDRVSVSGARARARRAHRTLVTELVARAEEQPAPARPVQHALAAVLDRAPVGVALVDDGDGVLVGWNSRAAMLLGLRSDDARVPVTRLVDAADQLRTALAGLGEGQSEGFSPAVLVAPVRSPGTWVEVNAATAVLEDGSRTTLLLLLDVTSRRAAEEARDALQDRLRVVRRSQEFLLRASDVLAASTTWTESLSRLATVALPTLGDLCLIDVVENGSLRRLAVSHADAEQRPAAAQLGERYAPLLGSDHPAAVALRERRTQWSADVDDAWLRRQSRDDHHAELLASLGIAGYIAVPLEVDGEPLGVVTLARGTQGRRFTHDDVVLAEELAGRVAVVVSKARRYDREHEIAVALQRSMLTALPDLAPWQVAARYVPAGVDTQVGGDWYDTFVLPGAPPVLVIGDVVGHDVTAAAAMGQVRSAMRALAWGRSDRPAEVLDTLDALNSAVRITDFATVVYAVVDTPADAGGGALLRWASAGHLPPLVLEPDGTARLLDPRPDVVIGIGRPGSRDRTEHRTPLAPGSTLLLYTDGLVERRSAPLADGLAALREQVARLSHLPLEDLCDAVVASRAEDQEDDIAVLALRLPGDRLGGPGR
nr:SpoIIE family protein phosphatase [uncultured Actinotalea sp.]